MTLRSKAVAVLPSLLFAGLAVLAADAPPGAAAGDLSVDEAYDHHSHHRHTELDPGAGFSRQEAVFLERLFRLIDLAIVEKTRAWIWFQSEGRKGAPVSRYRDRIDALLGELDRLPAPERLREVKSLIAQAIEDQRAHFEAWDRAVREVGSGTGEPGGEPAGGGIFMRRSSQKLHQAYDRLRALFPAAGPRNLDAFYDHLCVLDLL
ncbi:MAG: hypothetical protein ACRD6R_06200 [Candidatus Polarisedimenticolia bacterium]